MLLASLIEDFDRHGYEQEILYFHDGPIRHHVPKHITVRQVRGFFFRYDLLFFVRLYRMIKKSKPTVIHASLWAACLFGRLIACLCKVPIVCVSHAQPHYGGKFRTIIDRLTAFLTDHMIAVSPPIAHSLITMKLAHPAHLTIIPNGIDAPAFCRRAQEYQLSRSMLEIADTDFVIGSVGRLVPAKNYPLLIQAFSLLTSSYQQVRLIIVGTGPQEMLLRTQITSLNLEHRIHLITNNQFAFGYYALFDCFVYCSTIEWLSLALLEAMCSGIACIITTNDSDYPIGERAGNGITVTPYDPKAVADGVIRLMHDKELRVRLAEKSRYDSINKFNLNNMTNKYRSVFNNCAGVR